MSVDNENGPQASESAEFNRSYLAQSCAPACAGRRSEKSNNHLGLSDSAKRDLYPLPSDPRDLAEDPLGEPMAIQHVAQLLGCSIWTVRQRHLPSGLPHFRIGRTGKLMFYRKQVVQWILENQKQRR